MRRLATVILVGSSLLLAVTGVMALGMGRVQTSSHLGDPLEFSVALSSQAGEALAEDCIVADVFSGSSRVPDEMVRLNINRAANGLPTSLRVRTGTRIDEPLARIDLSFNCGTSLKRSYVVLIDPPVLQLAQTSREPVVASAFVPRPPPQAREPSPVSRPQRSRSAPRSTRSTRQASEARSGTRRVASATPNRQQRAATAKAARQARTAAAVQPDQGSSLKLESATVAGTGAPVAASPKPTAAAKASTAATAALAAASSALAQAEGDLVAVAGSASAAQSSASAAMSGLLGELAAKADSDVQTANAEQLRLMEESLAKLRTDNQSMRSAMAEMQGRLVDAEENSGWSSATVFALLALVLLLLLAVAGLLWRQASMRRESEWLKAAAAEEPTGIVESVGAPRSIVHPSATALRSAAGVGAAAAAARLAGAATTPGPRATLSTAALARAGETTAAGAPAFTAASEPAKSDDKSAAAHEITAIHDPRHEVSVDELIDLEQQADFFVVLGQDDAAIDLLMGHLQGTGGASPLPYLKLLEIHRRRDERLAYDRVRERFNRRFAAFATEWDALSGHNKAIEEYPEVVEKLQKQWARPTESMETLSALLFQRDESGQTFDLPAYGEVLFLYSLARDLAEHEPLPDGVDLLLPMDDGPDDAVPVPPVPPLTPAAIAAAGTAAAGAAAARNVDADAADELNSLPDLDWLPDDAPADTMPLNDPKPFGSSDDLGPLDLDINDEPEEPKGPLSKY